jgi:hypothetical protein
MTASTTIGVTINTTSQKKRRLRLGDSFDAFRKNSMPSPYQNHFREVVMVMQNRNFENAERNTLPNLRRSTQFVSQ